MLAGLSEDTQRVMAIAVAESQRLNHYYLGTEHIFIGLCKIEDHALVKVIERYHVDLEDLIQKMEEVIGLGSDPSWGHQMLITPRSSTVIRLAEEIARNYRALEVQPIHLLLALAVEGEGIPIRTLAQMGFDSDQLKSLILETLETKSAEEQQAPSASKTPFLNLLGRDLTFLARQRKLVPVIGRNEEIKNLAQILARKTKSNPLIIGEAGVGKSCLVEGLAQRAVHKDASSSIKDKRIIELSLASIVAGTKYRGEFEERLIQILTEVKENPEIILFIDEIHNLVGTGVAGDGTMDAANILKPALARGELQCIGATTISEYRKYIEKDAALERRFEVLRLAEPSGKETIDILFGVRKSYEDFHAVKILDEAIEAAVHLSSRYIPDRHFPDKAIDLMDMACSQVKLQTFGISHDDEAGSTEKKPEVAKDAIAMIVSQRIGIPFDRLVQDEAEKLLHMEEYLARSVIGQEQALGLVSQTIRAARTGLSSPRKPDGVFMFAGPSGVGKTQLAKSLAAFLFNNENRLIRFDMSEYMEKHTVSKLIGAPPGYVGYEEEGQLTGKVRTYPYSIILFDEIEKAHPDIFDILLQIFDEGMLTDSQGKKADFANTIIIMTSNIGNDIVKPRPIGFHVHAQEGGEADRKVYVAQIKDALKNTFRLELINRIDEVVVFNSLDEDDIRKIVFILLDEVRERLADRGLKMDVDDEVFSILIKHGYSETYGVREMNRTIDRLITKPMSEELLKQMFHPGDTVLVKVEDKAVAFKKGNTEILSGGPNESRT